MRTSLVAKLGAMVIAALLLAACGSLGGAGGGAADDYATDSGSQSGNAGTGDASQSDGGYSAGNDYGDSSGGEAAKGALQVGDSDYGQILTDSEGRSLYAFTKDTNGQPTCNAGCEDNWPPLLAEGKPTGSGDVNGDLLKTVSREDGTKQVMIGKWPLYYFAGDNAPSDTQGQGVNDVWFLVGPDGKLVKS